MRGIATAFDPRLTLAGQPSLEVHLIGTIGIWASGIVDDDRRIRGTATILVEGVGERNATHTDTELWEELTGYIDFLRADERAMSEDIFNLHKCRGNVLIVGEWDLPAEGRTDNQEGISVLKLVGRKGGTRYQLVINGNSRAWR